MPASARAVIAAALGASAVVLAVFLLRYPIADFRLPIGADATVYVWWSRAARVDGLAAAGIRAGSPSLMLLLGGATRSAQPAIAAGLGGMLAATAGCAGAAIARAAAPRCPAWVVALTVLFTGAFAAGLVPGYFATLVVAAGLLGAIALVAIPGRPALLLAIACLGASGTAHPWFLPVALVIVAMAALFARADRTRLLLLAGGGAGTTLGLAGIVALGGSSLDARTSADGLLRWAGLSEHLRSTFDERSPIRLSNYTLWLTPVLAWLGRTFPARTTRLLLLSWLGVCFVGGIASIVTDIVPGWRWLAFAFALPVLAAFGVWRVASAASSRALAVVAVCGIAAVILVWGTLQYTTARPVGTATGIGSIHVAGTQAHATAPGTPVVILIDPGMDPAGQMRLENLVRAYFPAERLADLSFVRGSEADLRAGRAAPADDPVLQALNERSATQLDDAERQRAVVLALPVTASPAELPAPWTLVLAGVAGFLVVGLVGAGWTWSITQDRALAVLLAPVVGMGLLMGTGVIVDALGVRLTSGIAMILTACIALAGAIVVLSRKATA